MSTTKLYISSTTFVLVIFPSKVVCTIWKFWILKFECFKQNSGIVNDFKWKSHLLQSCRSRRDLLQSCRSRRDLQLLYKVCFHLTFFEKVMNLFILQHGYHHRIIQQAGGENIFTTGSYGEAIVMSSTLTPPVGGAKQLWWWTIIASW